MASEGIYWFDSAGNQMTLEYSSDLTSSPLNWTAVPELKGLSRNPAATEQISFTHYGSTRKERRPGLPDDGTWDAVSNFLPKHATTAALIALYASGAVRYWRATYAKAFTASTVRANEIFTASIQTLGVQNPGAEDTETHRLEFTLLGAGDYTFIPES